MCFNPDREITSIHLSSFRLSRRNPSENSSFLSSAIVQEVSSQPNQPRRSWTWWARLGMEAMMPTIMRKPLMNAAYDCTTGTEASVLPIESETLPTPLNNGTCDSSSTRRGRCNSFSRRAEDRLQGLTNSRFAKHPLTLWRKRSCALSEG